MMYLSITIIAVLQIYFVAFAYLLVYSADGRITWKLQIIHMGTVS